MNFGLAIVSGSGWELRDTGKWRGKRHKRSNRAGRGICGWGSIVNVDYRCFVFGTVDCPLKEMWGSGNFFEKGYGRSENVM